MRSRVYIESDCVVCTGHWVVMHLFSRVPCDCIIAHIWVISVVSGHRVRAGRSSCFCPCGSCGEAGRLWGLRQRLLCREYTVCHLTVRVCVCSGPAGVKVGLVWFSSRTILLLWEQQTDVVFLLRYAWASVRDRAKAVTNDSFLHIVQFGLTFHVILRTSASHKPAKMTLLSRFLFKYDSCV